MLHLHEALHCENTGGPRAYVCVAGGGLAPRVVFGVRQAKILVAEAEENNLDAQDEVESVAHFRSLCEQDYHGVVRCVLGWACWKTYLGRPETDWLEAMR